MTLIEVPIIDLRKRQIVMDKNPFKINFKEYQKFKIRLLEEYGNLCQCCGKHVKLTIDHIFPKSLFPELGIKYDNLQLLCQPCNSDKGIKIIDYRGKDTYIPSIIEFKNFMIKHLKNKGRPVKKKNTKLQKLHKSLKKIYKDRRKLRAEYNNPITKKEKRNIVEQLTALNIKVKELNTLINKIKSKEK